MKKRLLSLALCLAMLLPTLLLFTSCTEEEVEETGGIAPMTIVIALMTDEKTNEAGIEATEKALNRITESNFNTHVELKLFTENEYYAKVEEALVARRAAYNNGDKSTSLGDVKDTIYDEEKNREVTAYPEPYENQIDIFFVGSKQKLVDYVLWKADSATDEQYATDPIMYADSLVAPLDADVTESAALLSKYLASGLMEAGKVYFAGDGAQYAIPSNAIYDNGEYMVIDKKLFDQSPYSIEEVNNVIALEEYLINIATEHPEITPLYNMGSMGFVSFTGRPSIISQLVSASALPADTGLEPKSMLSSTEFKNTLASIRTYASINGKYPVAGNDLSAAKEGEFAVGFVSATETEMEKYKENYYVIETNKAMVTNQQACGNMFAVSAFTSDTARCVQIINLLQTNSEAHNVLVYGEENVTYTVDESTQMIKRQYEGDAVYVMDIHKTGNLFITRQNSEMTAKELLYSKNDWALAKSASRHVFFGPYNGFEIAFAQTEQDSTELYMPSTDIADALEEAYNQMMAEVFKYDETAVDEEGNPLYASYEAYLEALDSSIKQANDNQISVQLAPTTGIKNIYRQYVDWKRFHHVVPA